MRAEWIAIAVVAGLGLYAIFVFNRLVRARNMVREGWSGIDVQLRRRSDLTPNLVEAVKGYAAHERALFDDIAAKRTSALNANGVAGRAAAEAELQAAALAAFHVTDCCGWGRVDFMRDPVTHKFYFIEINTTPGMTDHSLVPMAARQAGIDFPELCWRVLETSFSRALK